MEDSQQPDATEIWFLRRIRIVYYVIISSAFKVDARISVSEKKN